MEYAIVTSAKTSYEPHHSRAYHKINIFFVRLWPPSRFIVFLRFPYWDGLDSLKDNHKRNQLLFLLETNNWWGRNWKYCFACIKLHPRNEFELEDYAEWPTGRPRKKTV